ncbi:hypothetical protein SAZ11_12905 [Streptomyces sp. FXJ1.4098]|uniref:hypothetical protein n=1 Tax=Streptomyces sp. NPDC020845 TaxID=3365096 RepID=UPI0029921D43|nr:hypothetical protein [Streptomyces sp. FXJ1.4098]
MKFRRTLSAFAVAVVAAGVPLLSAPTAGAATTANWWDQQMHTNDGDPGGRVRFKADGDVVELCDIEADGWKVNLEVSGYHYYDEFSVGGNGNCVTHSASNGHDMGEGAGYSFQIYLSKSGHPFEYEDTSVWWT